MYWLSGEGWPILKIAGSSCTLQTRRTKGRGQGYLDSGVSGREALLSGAQPGGCLSPRGTLGASAQKCVKSQKPDLRVISRRFPWMPWQGPSMKGLLQPSSTLFTSEVRASQWASCVHTDETCGTDGSLLKKTSVGIPSRGPHLASFADLIARSPANQWDRHLCGETPSWYPFFSVPFFHFN